ncbi:serine/threonine protein kinase [Dictyobacter arantiisoli]|uniref:non-specific serine/threonine protein kinase n=1 Tax=Dictyobacter arantiisoli TaxID=2014874 RepID=A0A5A5THK9_9CHLR|nr:serine/threonine-protein kinase [Dictyobacter arantiisoli]GCF10698.1 hypothetical protein KDI_42620 [Dictyobacter arantiisoli]
MTVNDELAGSMLGNYILEHNIGYHDSVSSVYLARQMFSVYQVAVKIIRPQPSRKDGFPLRFQHAISLMARLEHPNIMPVLDYSEYNQLAYFVMPYISNNRNTNNNLPASDLDVNYSHSTDVTTGHCNLEQRLRRQGRLSPQQTLSYLLQAASALDYAHSLGIVHGNLKPGNILFTANDQLLLTDFCISYQVAGHPDLDQPLRDAPYYMSPEMIRGEALAAASDIYQLGILLFQMLSGWVPFKAANVPGVIRQHLQEPLPSLHANDPALPFAIDAVLYKATAKSCEDRYASAGALARAFAEALEPPHPRRQSHHIDLVDDILAQMELCSPQCVLTSGPPAIPLAPLPVTPLETDPASAVTDFGFSTLHTQILPLPSTILRQPSFLRSLLLKSLSCLVILSLIVITCLQVFGAFAAPPDPSALPIAQGQALVLGYYADMRRQDYRSAYSLLDHSFQHRISYSQFMTEYQSVSLNSFIFKQTIERGPGAVNIEIMLHSQTSLAVRACPMPHSYMWNATLTRQQDGSWKIDQASLQQL